MKSHLEELGDRLRRHLSRLATQRHTEDAENTSVGEYRLQVQVLRSRVRRLEQTLSEARRNNAELRETVSQSRSSFEVAWSDFVGEPTIEDRLSSLEPGDNRARRWLLTP